MGMNMSLSAMSLTTMLGRRAAAAGVTLAQNLVSDAGTVEEGFEDATEWSVILGNTPQDNEVNFVQGTQSVRLDSTGSGSNNRFQKVTNFVASDKMRIHIFTDGTEVSVTLYLSPTTDFSEFFVYSISTSRFSTGWNVVEIRQDEFTNQNGGADWADPIVRMRINQTNGGVDSDYSYDNFRDGITAVPGVVFTFDDARESIYNDAFSYMQTKDVLGTFYIHSDQVGDSGQVTEAELTEMYNAGWDIANHTPGNTNLTTLTQAQQETRLSTTADYLDGLGFTRSSHHVSYPLGGYNDDTLAAMAATNMLTGRTTTDGYDWLPMPNEYEIKRQALNASTSLATAKGFIDTAISEQRVVVLLLHEIVESGATGLQWNESDFQDLIDYIATKGAAQEIYPLTISQLYELLSDSITVDLPTA